MKQWSVGRVTLLGDACHAMLPFVAQGAAQAIEDGATLAALLTGSAKDEVAKRLQDYEKARIGRTARVQGMAAANMTRFHLADGPEQVARDIEMKKSVTDWSPRSIGWLYGHDANLSENL